MLTTLIIPNNQDMYIETVTKLTENLIIIEDIIHLKKTINFTFFTNTDFFIDEVLSKFDDNFTVSNVIKTDSKFEIHLIKS